MAWMENDGVESVKGKTAVSSREIVVGGTALSKQTVRRPKMRDDAQTNTDCITERDTNDPSLSKWRAK